MLLIYKILYTFLHAEVYINTVYYVLSKLEIYL
jgi:hypothetical protein